MIIIRILRIVFAKRLEMHSAAVVARVGAVIAVTGSPQMACIQVAHSWPGFLYAIVTLGGYGANEYKKQTSGIKNRSCPI